MQFEKFNHTTPSNFIKYFCKIISIFVIEELIFPNTQNKIILDFFTK